MPKKDIGQQINLNLTHSCVKEFEQSIHELSVHNTCYIIKQQQEQHDPYD
jgi:hypothetical protein